MLDNLATRSAHWNLRANRAPREEHDLTDSLPYPFDRIEYLLHDKDVLEIGPGRGRQYDRLKSVVKSYSICDIAPECLEEPLFQPCRHRFLLKDYTDEFPCTFDVVHFWYVLHHVKANELGAFFAFAARHMNRSGIVLFNSPQIGNTIEWYTDDGLGTTRHTEAAIYDAMSQHFRIFVCEEIDKLSTGWLFGGLLKWH